MRNEFVLPALVPSIRRIPTPFLLTRYRPRLRRRTALWPGAGNFGRVFKRGHVKDTVHLMVQLAALAPAVENLNASARPPFVCPHQAPTGEHAASDDSA